MQVYSQTTGKLEAILLDEGILTELRTAAVGALVVCKQFARTTQAINCIGIVGTGVQARYQLQLLQRVTKCRSVCVYGRTPGKVQEYVDDLKGMGYSQVQIATTANELLEKCDLIITTTSSREPVLGGGINKSNKPNKNLLIVCIGSDSPGKVELDVSFKQQADLLLADNIEQSLVRGEYQCFNNDFNKHKMVSLGQMLMNDNNDDPENNKKKRKTTTGDDGDYDEDKDNGPRLDIFDSSGVALQDCVIAEMVYKTLQSKLQK